jgi:hypothetical protein
MYWLPLKKLANSIRLTYFLLVRRYLSVRLSPHCIITWMHALLPIGGVSPSTAASWLKAGAAAVGMGSNLSGT